PGLMASRRMDVPFWIVCETGRLTHAAKQRAAQRGQKSGCRVIDGFGATPAANASPCERHADADGVAEPDTGSLDQPSAAAAVERARNVVFRQGPDDETRKPHFIACRPAGFEQVLAQAGALINRRKIE